MIQVCVLSIALTCADAPPSEADKDATRGAPAHMDADVIFHMDLDAIFAGLHSADQHLRRGAEWALRWQRKQIVRRLQQIAGRGVKGELPEANTEMAILLLGEFRAPKAAEGLVEILKFNIHPPGPSANILYHHTPQVMALIQIGLPSLDPLIKKVATTDDDIIRERAAIVIDQILGTDMGVFYTRDRQNRENDPLKRQRLKRLTEQIDKTERNRKGKVNAGALRPPPVIAPESK
jgi:hypothetical protein